MVIGSAMIHGVSMGKDHAPATIDDHVFDGIRKTIRRFRLRPHQFFTEAELHTSLYRDIMEGASGVLLHRTGASVVSLLHQEYPTNFRYSKELTKTVYPEERLPETAVDSGEGGRGNYDLAVLEPSFVEEMLSGTSPVASTFMEGLRHVINKDIRLSIARHGANLESHLHELRFAIEVKYLHVFNVSSSNMLDEVIGDCEKLRLALHHADGNVRAINLVFCSSAAGTRGPRGDRQDTVVERLRALASSGVTTRINGATYQIPDGVSLIFTESYLDASGDAVEKTTPKPLVWPKPGKSEWVDEMRREVLR
jgi:hypothetical protein